MKPSKTTNVLLVYCLFTAMFTRLVSSFSSLSRFFRPSLASSRYENRFFSVPSRIEEALTSALGTILDDQTNNNTIPLKKMKCLVGVSGGCDSVALLHGLVNISRTSDSPRLLASLDLHVVHFDHQQRGADSDGDKLFVEELCEQYRLPFTCFTWNNESNSATFSQNTARQWRQNCQEKLLNEFCGSDSDFIGAILTAHHADDSNETLLLKLIRGAHLTNLRGMELVTRRNGCWYLRPLLKVSKQEIVDYLKAKEWSWREDESNKSSKYLRNRVRNELMPLLVDLVGNGEMEILQRRIDNIVDQSLRIQHDLVPRAEAYLDKTMLPDGSFRIPYSWGAVEFEALHKWMRIRFVSTSFSYHDVQRVATKCTDNTSSHFWELHLSGLCKINRVGQSLVVRDEDKSKVEVAYVDLEVHDRLIQDQLVLHLPEEWQPNKPKMMLTFAENNNLAMIPPWKTSSVKLYQFLRGQGVPAESRPGTRILLVSHESGECELVAVYIGSKRKWIVHKKFSSPGVGLWSVMLPNIPALESF